MSIVDVREKIPNDVFTALELNACLAGYRHKGAKISSMTRKGEIIPVRRGLYVFPEQLRRETLSRGALANRIYGPSYVSEDFALGYYGLIPETVQMVTSIARGRTREFTTPFGVFRYRYCRSRAYSLGVTLAGEGQNRFLIATPEKALFDKTLFDQRFDGSDVEQYLFEDLRIDEEALRRFRRTRIAELAPFMCGRLKNLGEFLKHL
jgi:predicted transcriptional regulator of viral defense system